MGRTQRKRNKRHKINAILADVDEVGDLLGAIYKFLHKQGWQNDTELSMRSYPNTGRGLCSKSQQFSNGETLIRLPVDCLISVTKLESDAAFKALFNVTQFDKERRISFQALLAFYILFHRHQGANSPINAYIATLPKMFTTPYFCPLRELKCLPAALLEQTVAQNRKIRESYALLLELLDLPTVCDCCGGDNFADIYTLNAFKWAYFVVNTRSVFVDSRQMKLNSKNFFSPLLNGSTNLALAPFLDLFNHSDVVSTKAQLEPSQMNGSKGLDYVLTLVAAAVTPIPRYAQIFISYGALTNLKLLTEYGFFLENSCHDYFEFSLTDIECFLKETPPYNRQVMIHRNKFKFIRDHNLNDQLFMHSKDGVSHNLRVVLHLLLKEESHFPNILNQVAFGAADELADMADELALLVKYKILEYKNFIKALEMLSELSESGAVVLNYMRNCVVYLETILESNF